MSELNWGIIGLGAITHDFAESLKALERSPYAVASRELHRAQEFQKQYNATKAYGSYQELLQDENVDIVYIATVNSQHMDNIMMCLEYNKHIMCEKAIWGDYAQMQNAKQIAQEKNLILAEGMTIFHMPIMKKVKSLIQNGELGKIKFIEAELGSLKEDDPENRFFSKELGGGAMLDIGTYGLSFVSYFMSGEITQVKSTMSKYRTGVDESWAISLKSSTQEVASVNLTFRAKLPKRAIIAGDKAYITIDNYVRADEAVFVTPDGNKVIICEGKTANAMQYEIIDMEKAVNTGDSGHIYLDETMKVVKLMDELLASPGE